MGLGHARGVLDLHRGYFRFFSGETAKTIVDARWTEGFSRDGRRQWTEQGSLGTRDFLLGSFFYI